MPRQAKKYTEVFSVKATPEELQRLRALSEETGRTPSEVVRLLIRQAVVMLPDIRLSGPMT